MRRIVADGLSGLTVDDTAEVVSVDCVEYQASAVCSVSLDEFTGPGGAVGVFICKSGEEKGEG